ncbi:MAG TPA: HAD family hydrolase [Candidatus Tumulicola sp.]|nr:HAD family hydrolase [Candidatus Tumulicola sp.]
MADTHYDAVAFDLFGTLVDQTATAMDGAVERLGELRGAAWAIVTSANASLAELLIAHARLPRPPVLVTGDDVERNKPAPEGYALAARRLRVECGRVLASRIRRPAWPRPGPPGWTSSRCSTDAPAILRAPQRGWYGT